jgi:ATPase subunit of ABC transporter with duplicated ATPase domains
MDAEAPEPVEMDATWRFAIPSSEPLGRPIIAIDNVSFDYNAEKPDGTKKTESEYLLQKVDFGVDNNSKIAILGANGQVIKTSFCHHNAAPKIFPTSHPLFNLHSIPNRERRRCLT